MLQEPTTVGPWNPIPTDNRSGQSIVALLALVGSKSMDVEELRRRTRLSPYAFRNLVEWLQWEYLVDIVSNLNGSEVQEKVELTEKGESVLISVLERTCELPELH